MRKWVSAAIGAVIAISMIPILVDITDTLVGTGKPLDGTTAGTLLGLVPFVFVAAIVVGLFALVGRKGD